jgi:hypothetical protein
MVSYGRVDLLSHELSHKYLQMKWNAYGKYIHLAQLILYILYLAILTTFASNIVEVNGMEQEAENNSAGQISIGSRVGPTQNPNSNTFEVFKNLALSISNP